MIDVVGAVFTREAGASSGAPAGASSGITTEVLAFRRAAHKSEAGGWEFAGGKVEPGEIASAALTREIAEELGVEIAVGECVASSETEVAGQLVRLTCYFVTVAGEHPAHSTDHDELRWMPVSELHTLNWLAPDVPIVEELQSGLS